MLLRLRDQTLICSRGSRLTPLRRTRSLNLFKIIRHTGWAKNCTQYTNCKRGGASAPQTYPCLRLCSLEVPLTTLRDFSNIIFRLVITYLHLLVQVCFSATVGVGRTQQSAVAELLYFSYDLDLELKDL